MPWAPLQLLAAPALLSMENLEARLQLYGEPELAYELFQHECAAWGWDLLRADTLQHLRGRATKLEVVIQQTTPTREQHVCLSPAGTSCSSSCVNVQGTRRHLGGRARRTGQARQGGGQRLGPAAGGERCPVGH